MITTITRMAPTTTNTMMVTDMPEASGVGVEGGGAGVVVVVVGWAVVVVVGWAVVVVDVD
jgi:hypothetical protein